MSKGVYTCVGMVECLWVMGLGVEGGLGRRGQDLCKMAWEDVSEGTGAGRKKEKKSLALPRARTSFLYLFEAVPCRQDSNVP